MRIKKIFSENHFLDFQRKALCWAEKHTNFQYLNGNNLPYTSGSFPCLLAIGQKQSVSLSSSFPISHLLGGKNEWFGYMGYGYGNKQYHTEFLGFHEGEFFQPEAIVKFHAHDFSVEIENEADVERIFKEIENTLLSEEGIGVVEFVARISKEEYVSKIGELKAHLKRGNVYQINFCTRFDAEQAFIDPIKVYEKLNTVSPMPFSALLKIGDRYVICASPERYLKKEGRKLTSQPIKGTAPRGKGGEEDLANIRYLESSPKERAENVMIVDLVRNDLSRICLSGTVNVEKLCEVRTFQSLHQMISTVVGELGEQTSIEEVIKATFPMGSMTGAPKIRAMELIHELEVENRGPFSGALGFVGSNGDFDFNVLIRSIFYNSTTKQLSFSVGSGITVLSDPEAEYEECMLKASAITQVLGN